MAAPASYDVEYVCTLDTHTQEKARRELNEDPRDRLAAVESFRQWILQQPYLKCRTDTRYLLPFLRGAKFSQLRAREMLVGNLSMATKIPEWFQNVDPLDPALSSIVDCGFCIPLPKKTEDGCAILLYKIGALDPKKYTDVATDIKIGIIVGATLMRDEATQVHGVIFIMDFTGVTTKHMTRWKLDDLRKWTNAWQKNMPGRFKAFHYYNAGVLFETIIAMVRPFMSKKYTDRIKVHDTLESLYRHVPRQLLPDEYQPDDVTGVGSMQDLIGGFRKQLTDPLFRAEVIHMTSGQYGIDEKLRLSLADQPNSSFRKLNID